MKSVLVLAGLWCAQGRLFERPSPRPKIKYLGSGARHNHTNFHAIISAKSMEDVTNLTVTYSDCGDSAACDTSTTFLTDIQVGTQVDANPKATDTGQEDGEYIVFDVEYAYTGSTLRNHILTVFSDGLGEESIICGVGREVNQGDLNGACTPCEAGKKYKDSTKIYDAECTECTQTCPDGHRVMTACTADTDTVCSSDADDGCATTDCGNGQYVSEACHKGSASEASTTPGECASCYPRECEGDYFVASACFSASTYVKGRPATCMTMGTDPSNSTHNYYLRSEGKRGSYSSVGSNNIWKLCTEPSADQYVSTPCGDREDTTINDCKVCDTGKSTKTECRPGSSKILGSDTQCGGWAYCTEPVDGQYVSKKCGDEDTKFADCKDCNSLHKSTKTECNAGSPTEEGSAGQCSDDCLTGFIKSGDNCVSESFMFGWVYREDADGVCRAKCVKWTGTLNDDFFDSDERGFKTPSAQICALLSQREPLLRSKDCGRQR